MNRQPASTPYRPRFTAAPRLVAAAVFAGMAVAFVASVQPPVSTDEQLPGVALGSPTLLLVERAIAFFFGWLVLLVVSAHALRGRLPIEISGRGLRYADAEQTQHGVVTTQVALSRIDAEMDAMRSRVSRLEARPFDDGSV